MQLIVKARKLNKRKVIPSFLPDPNNIAGIVNENFSFEGDEVVNVPNPDLGKWYVDRDGYFYWGGGLSESIITEPTLVAFDSAKMSWGHRFYNIPFIWNDLKTAGKGVTVAVIDTGIDKDHPDLKNNIHPASRSFVPNSNSISDINGHGTNMAGIIAADGFSKVYGIAPEAKLLVVKGTVHKGGVNLDEFADAINFAATITEVDIVSISYSFVEILVNPHPALREAIDNCLNAGKIIVAAIGNAHTSNPDILTFPACFNKEFPDKKGILAIGAFNENGNLCDFSNWSPHLRCLAPGDLILTTDKGSNTTKDTGSSIATAFAAGCLALLISYSKLNGKKIENCIPAILSSCDDLGNQIGFDNGSGYGRINLRNAISKIKLTA